MEVPPESANCVFYDDRQPQMPWNLKTSDLVNGVCRGRNFYKGDSLPAQLFLGSFTDPRDSIPYV